MSSNDLYRTVMAVDPPVPEGHLDAAEREELLELWARPGLGVRDRRFLTIACVSAAVDVAAMLQRRVQ